jgi:hypothetical protein
VTVKVGQIGFAHNKGLMGRLIRLGEHLRFKRSDWNHQFAVVDVDANGNATIIQATLKGVILSPLESVATGGRYILLDAPAEVDVTKMLEFFRAQVGLEYGLLTDIAMGIDIVSWQWVPALRGARKESWQCAALINEGMRFGGWLHNWLDIYSIFPQQSYDALMGESPIGDFL